MELMKGPSVVWNSRLRVFSFFSATVFREHLSVSESRVGVRKSGGILALKLSSVLYVTGRLRAN